MDQHQDLPRLTSGPPNPLAEADPRYWSGTAPDYGYEAAPEPEWRHALAVLLRYKWLIVLCALAGGGAGNWFARQAVPQYMAAAVLRVATQPESRVPVVMGRDGAGAGELPTELELLRSRAMARAVVDSLGMQLRAPAPLRAVLEHAVLRAGEHAVVTLEFGPRTYSVVGARGTIAGVAAYGNVLATDAVSIRVRQRPQGLRRARVELRSRSYAINEITENLHAKGRQGTQIVDVSFTSWDPAFAADVVNTVARVYQLASRDHASRQARARQEFNSAQLVRADSAYDAARAELDAFRVQTGRVGSNVQFDLWQQTTLMLGCRTRVSPR